MAATAGEGALSVLCSMSHVHTQELATEVSVPGTLCLPVSIPEAEDQGQEQNGTCGDYSFETPD